MKKMVNIAVIGAGRIGTIHARNLATKVDRANLVAVSDVREQAAKECAQKAGNPEVYTDYTKLLATPEIDAVVICTSTDIHVQIIADSAEAGKDVFCEKPIALDLDEIDHALNAIDRTGIKFQVGFSRRFDPSFSRARESVKDGEIGDPHVVKLTSRDPEPPPMGYVKASGGLFVDMTIHDFDMARFIIGEEVEEVYAQGSVLVEPEIGEVGDVDTAGLILKYESGAIGLVDNSREANYGYDQRLEVFGSGGKIEVSNPRKTEMKISDERGATKDQVMYFFTDRYEEAYYREMEAFTESIKDNRQPSVSGEDGRMAVVLADAAAKSLKRNRPVKVEEVE